MSAYLCDNEHLSRLAAYACRRPCGTIWHTGRRFDLTDARTVAHILYDENVRSLTARYGAEEHAPFVFDPCAFAGYAHPPVAIIKACHAYSYQTCETDGWATTLAYAIIQHIIGGACRSLPGYDDAEWGLSVPAHARCTRHAVTEGVRRG